MGLEEALKLLKNAVKNCGTIDQMHIDLTVVAASERETYQKALAISALAIKEGKITRDEFMKRLNLN
jgi:hypothetical protein